MSRRLVLATSNPHKVTELAVIVRAAGLPLTVCSARSLGPAPEVAEDQGSFEAHARLKALTIAEWLRSRGEPGTTLVLADDSGICVEALDGAPGVDSAYFAGPQADDAANNARLVAELNARGLDRSPAYYLCVLALTRVDGAPIAGADEAVRLFTGRWDGTVRTTPRGSGGFGYDPYFWPTGSDRSSAELPPAEKNALSHRGRATAQLLAALPAVLAC
ncbi:XTP/dITP diphosphohydrolase [Nannocystis exedens]|uniref:dITP/XTP pyrophosphatase n=1 Tax=Nannocystis exedens TaxID=54 RepID=A0A1I1Z1P9_9BACT|nr:non-canonical purine NTP pyrophosphatase [Nannocystis exedens]PCC75206.1 non-canonical purine NTP pyrophosphatase [Nannocystis exedens]SFE25661.1 XTP/dITP diphosphohydrolase [Nannocystis exedens]